MSLRLFGVRPGMLAALAVFGGLVAVLWHLGLADGPLLARGARNIGIFAQDLVPPDASVLPAVAGAMVETVEIAFAGTLLGFIGALPLALAANDTVSGRPVAGAVRMFLALVRTIPALLWAILFVVAVGLGARAGVLGLAMYSMGYMGKLFADAFDDIDPEVVEAVRGVGVGRLQLARFAILPEAANAVLAQTLFVFEYNVRASSILGFVGAGGIGFYLLGYVQSLQYDRLMTAILVTFAAVVVIDQASVRVRRRFLSASSHGPART